MMGKYLLAVPSSAVAGQDDDYNRWYDGEHLRDVCALPGVVSGRRYDALPNSPGQPPATYLALYEIETDDPMTVLAELGKRMQSGEYSLSPALDRSTSAMWLYKAH
jgi:hypothetical protein